MSDTSDQEVALDRATPWFGLLVAPQMVGDRAATLVLRRAMLLASGPGGNFLDATTWGPVVGDSESIICFLEWGGSIR